MKTEIIATIIVILVIGGVIFVSYELNKNTETKKETSQQSTVKATSSKSTSSTGSSSTSKTKTSPPNYNNLIKNLPKNQMIKDLPSGKSLQLKFFSLSKGERIWEKSFIVSNREMKEGKLDNPEVTFTIHSKYVNQITSSNLCDIMKTASRNKDLGFESELGYASLAWKYSSLLKYKSCFV